MPTPIVPNLHARTQRSFWMLSEIFVGPDGSPSQVYVPNVDNLVLDWSGGFYRVNSVDNSTHLSTLVPWSLNNLRGGVRAEDILLGSGPGSQNDDFRIYVDTRTTPFRMNFDSALYFKNSQAHHVKLFRGTDVNSATGQVISAMINGSGNVTSQNIPLETTQFLGGTNPAIKSPRSAWITERLTDGEPVSCVVYTASGEVVHVSVLLTRITNFMARSDADGRFVTGIKLVSPYISTADTTVIEVPLNMTLSSIPLKAQVSYNDGTAAVYTVDGSRFELMGRDNYISSTLGGSYAAVLQYSMPPEEQSVNTGSQLAGARVVQKEYTITTVQSDSQYSAKFYVQPVWNGTLVRYELKVYLTNLDRMDVFDVTDKFEYGAQSLQFDGSNYDSIQKLTLAFDMDKLGGSYSYYRYVETIEVELRSPGSVENPASYFVVDYGTPQKYGVGISAIVRDDLANNGARKLDISQGEGSVNGLLSKLYDPLAPLILSPAENKAPIPTHINIIIGTFSRTVPIENALGSISNIVASLGQGTNIQLEFVLDTADGLRYLGTTNMVARYI